MSARPVGLRWAGLLLGAVGRAAVLALAGLFAATAVDCASVFEVVNLDGPGEGLNDPTSVTPRGGNPATTLGAARFAAVEFAVAVWAESLSSTVPVRVGVRFDPLGGTAEAAVLGFAGAEAVFRDFAGAPRAGTWYPAPLADKLAGYDLGGAGSLDLTATFNSDVDGPVVFGSGRFDYGFDDAPPAGDVSFVKVALHELAHGLGFTTFVDQTTGAKLLGYDDAYLEHLERHGAVPAEFPAMSDVERLSAMTSGADLHWTGPAAVAAGAGLSAGRGEGGHLAMYGPSPAEPGASLVHFSSAMEPDQVLEPFYLTEAESPTGFALAAAVLADVGWGGVPSCETVAAGPRVLVEESFDDGDFAGWEVVDFGANEGPSAWAVVGGKLLQSGNIYGDRERGTWAVWEEGYGWTDVSVGVQMRSSDDDWIGLLFRYQDANNFYRFDWYKQGSKRRLSRMVGGVSTVLAQDTVPYTTGRTYFVEARAVGDVLAVKVDGLTVLTAVDGLLSSGSVALSSNANTGSSFDAVRVVGDPEPEPVPFFREDFEDQNTNGWTVQDFGTSSAPSSWSAASRTLRQSSNIWNDPLIRGTLAVYSAGLSWTDYRLGLQLWSTDDDTLGVLFRYVDAQNFYQLSWRKQNPRRWLRKVVGGVSALLAEDSVPYSTSEPYYVEITAIGPQIEVWVDGQGIFSVEDPSLPTGTVGLSSYENAGSSFDAIVVTDPPGRPAPRWVEDFADGAYDGWSIVDVGTTGAPSSWSASSKAMVQSSNIYGDALQRGTMAVYGGGMSWEDVEVRLALSSADDDEIGVAFRYQDADNFYRFDWDRQSAERRLVRVVGGVLTVLASDAVPYWTAQPYTVEVSAAGDRLGVKVDGAAVFSVTDGALGSGTIALCSYGNTGSSFDDIVVRDPPEELP